MTPTYADVQAAAARLEGKARKTPVMTSRTADDAAGAHLFFKAENFQRGGAFKFRGAYNALSKMNQTMRSRGVIAVSSGNHAQGVALAGRLLGAPITIIMPKDAPLIKIQATRGYGAEVILYDRYTDDRDHIAAELSRERGAPIVHPYDNPDIVAGQGTAAKELFEEVGELDLLVTPLGGGGLLSGSALSAAALSPRCRVFGVEPEAGDDGRQSFRKGEVVTIAAPRSIADGALATYVGKTGFPILQAHVCDIAVVPDAALVRAMIFFAERMKMIVEPTGCLAAAAVMEGVLPCRGMKVGIILSGGNVDLAAFARLTAAA